MFIGILIFLFGEFEGGLIVLDVGNEKGLKFFNFKPLEFWRAG